MPSDDPQREIETILLRAIAGACQVPPSRTVSQWAEAERVVAAKSGSPWPGRWSGARVPYLRQIMDVMTLSHPARRVTFVKAAQLGGSEGALNLIGQCICETPAPIIVALPSIDMMRGYNRLKLDPMITSCPALHRRVEDVVSRDEDASTATFKSFPDGYLQLVTANSSANLQMRTARVIVMEELSEYPFDVDGRGDPVEQLEARTSMYAGREKIISISTPGDEGNCRITAEYLRSSRGRYLIACPSCGERHTLEWDSLRWPKGKPEEARHHCPHCGDAIAHRFKPAMLASGEWVHEVPALLTVHAGFTLNGLYSPAVSWADLAAQWERIQGDEPKLKSFVQQKLGRAWRVAGDAPDWQRLYDRREEWTPGAVPRGGLVLTAGVDVQRDRLEASVWAWGRNRESWLVDHVVIAGSPFQWRSWEQLVTLLDTVYPSEAGGALPISLAAVDSSDGVSTAEVYAFTRRVGQRRAIPIKGRDNLPQAIAPGQRVDVKRSGQKVGTLKPWLVGVSFLKGELYGQLRLDRPTLESGDPFPAGYVHLPVHVAGEELCRQIVAEELRRTKTKTGFARLEWVKTRDRNEALDCRIYARAAAAVLGIERWSDKTWSDVEDAIAARAPSRPPIQARLDLTDPDDSPEDEAAAPAPQPPAATEADTDSDPAATPPPAFIAARRRTGWIAPSRPRWI